jgi:hypothetical protein
LARESGTQTLRNEIVMRILGIAGSLKEGADTEYLLDEVLKAA